MISVESWDLQAFQQADQSGTLDTSPEYQRRPVWSEKDEMLLIDSVARGVPIGALTLYVDDSEGYNKYEVIDGKQRLTAILKYLAGKIEIKTSFVEKAALDDDEFDTDSDCTTQEFHNRTFNSLAVKSKFKLLQYKIPVFIVQGERSESIRAFSRMNRSSYSLRPQEIRNAFFVDSYFLKKAIAVSELLNSELATDSEDKAFLVELGAISRNQYDRMQDVQLISELLVLLLSGPQHRRDTLDHHYELYSPSSGGPAQALESASSQLVSIFKQLWEVADRTPLGGLHFPGGCENDIYGLVGAFHERGLLTKPQMKDLHDELRTVIQGFRGQVERYVKLVRDGQTLADDSFEPLVEEYGRGFLGGQLNSQKRRASRIDVWVQVINGVVKTLDPKASFSDTQRRLIWINSQDKICARCGGAVGWVDYHAGHKIAHANGGRTTVENGQVEHSKCNLAAGALDA